MKIPTPPFLSFFCTMADLVDPNFVALDNDGVIVNPVFSAGNYTSRMCSDECRTRKECMYMQYIARTKSCLLGEHWLDKQIRIAHDFSRYQYRFAKTDAPMYALGVNTSHVWLSLVNGMTQTYVVPTEYGQINIFGFSLPIGMESAANGYLNFQFLLCKVDASNNPDVIAITGLTGCVQVNATQYSTSIPSSNVAKMFAVSLPQPMVANAGDMLSLSMYNIGQPYNFKILTAANSVGPLSMQNFPLMRRALLTLTYPVFKLDTTATTIFFAPVALLATSESYVFTASGTALSQINDGVSKAVLRLYPSATVSDDATISIGILPDFDFGSAPEQAALSASFITLSGIALGPWVAGTIWESPDITGLIVTAFNLRGWDQVPFSRLNIKIQAVSMQTARVFSPTNSSLLVEFKPNSPCTSQLIPNAAQDLTPGAHLMDNNCTRFDAAPASCTLTKKVMSSLAFDLQATLNISKVESSDVCTTKPANECFGNCKLDQECFLTNDPCHSRSFATCSGPGDGCQWSGSSSSGRCFKANDACYANYNQNACTATGRCTWSSHCVIDQCSTACSDEEGSCINNQNCSVALECARANSLSCLYFDYCAASCASTLSVYEKKLFFKATHCRRQCGEGESYSSFFLFLFVQSCVCV